MTIQGAVYELNNMLSSNDIPCYWKPVIKKIIETVEQSEQNVGTCQQNVGEMSEQTGGDSVSLRALAEKFNLPSAEKTAEQSYSWCDGCKEYDTEKHCCHRYSSFIRESLQENINAVLEDIKAEIDKEIISGDSIDYINGLNMALMIINEKHISGKE